MTTLFEFAPTGAIVGGSAVPPSASVYDTVDAGIVYDTGVVFKDLTASAKADNSAGTTVRTLEQIIGSAVSTRRLVRVMRASAFTANNFVTLTRWRNGSSSIGEIRLTNTGKLVVRDSVASATLATSTPAVTFGQDFRFEVDIVGTSVTVRLYLDADAAAPDATMGPFTFSGGSFDRVLDGVGTAATGTVVRVLYAADGDTENPSLSRWSVPGTTGAGIQSYLVTASGEVLITSSETV